MSARVVRAVLVEPHAIPAEQMRRDLWGHPVLSLVAVAASAVDALTAVEAHHADVVLVDAAVPELATLAGRLPVVALTDADGTGGLDALAAGAVDAWARSADVDDLAWRACAAASAHPSRCRPPTSVDTAADSAEGLIVAVAAGTGGLHALTAVLAGLPADAAALVVTPLPAPLVAAWARACDAQTLVRLSVAADGDRVAAGRALVAPGDAHLMLRSIGDGEWAVAVRDGPTVYHHRPAAEVLFNSVAAAGPAAVAALLGGVGPDGVGGLAAVRRAGGRTATESPQTAVCSGRPALAVGRAAAEVAAPADQLAAVLLGMAGGGQRSNRAA